MIYPFFLFVRVYWIGPCKITMRLNLCFKFLKNLGTFVLDTHYTNPLSSLFSHWLTAKFLDC